MTTTDSVATLATPTEAASSTTTTFSNSPHRLNHTAVEQQFMQFLNQERQDRGRQPVSQRAELREMGRQHSLDMAQKDYFDHVEPDGDTIEDRYEKRGLIPECHLPIQGSDRYYAGAENIGKTHWKKRVRKSWESGTEYLDEEREVAQYLFQMWMHSEPHREAMLVASADEAGLGIAVSDTNEIYASLELC